MERYYCRPRCLPAWPGAPRRLKTLSRLICSTADQPLLATTAWSTLRTAVTSDDPDAWRMYACTTVACVGFFWVYQCDLSIYEEF